MYIKRGSLIVSNQLDVGERITQLDSESEVTRGRAVLSAGFMAMGACVAIISGVNTNYNDLSVAGELATLFSAGVAIKGLMGFVGNSLKSLTLGHRIAALEGAQVQSEPNVSVSIPPAA